MRSVDTQPIMRYWLVPNLIGYKNREFGY